MYVEIPMENLNHQTLRNVIEAYCSREGTDYGHDEHNLDAKVQEVKDQIGRGDAKIFFDPEEQSINILSLNQIATAHGDP